MPISQTPSLQELKTFFGGSNNFSDYVRGGAYVPDIPANSAISTTVNGLALAQFKGADMAAAVDIVMPATGGYSDISSSSSAVGAYTWLQWNASGWIQYGNSTQANTNDTRWASAATTAYSVRFMPMLGTAGNYVSPTLLARWQAITSTTTGPTIVTTEHFGPSQRTLRIRAEIALTANTSAIIASYIITINHYYDDGSGGGIIIT